jgi:septal ring factor EnvC (AmiA/AmiB activator)
VSPKHLSSLTSAIGRIRLLTADFVKFIQPLLTIAVQSPIKSEILNGIKSLSLSSQKVLESPSVAPDSDSQSQQTEREIAVGKRQIEDFETQLKQISEPAAADHSQIDLIARTKDAIAEVERETAELRDRLAKSQATQQKVRAERGYDDSVQTSRRQATDRA